MRTLIKLCIPVLAAFWLSASANPTDALKTLSQVAPTTQWDARNAIEVDIDCDNQKDYVFLTQVENKVTIGMVLGK